MDEGKKQGPFHLSPSPKTPPLPFPIHNFFHLHTHFVQQGRPAEADALIYISVLNRPFVKADFHRQTYRIFSWQADSMRV